MALYNLPTLFRAQVIHRPSKLIKSPYVADIRLEDGTDALCHTPGLGCCGLVSTGKYIYVSKAANANAKTAFTAQISETADSEGTYYIGIHPMVSQAIAAKLLDRIPGQSVTWKSEVKINEHTRLDFVGTTENSKKIYVEVKNAMIANVEPRLSRRAVFPEGYRKSMKDTISPRAVKHAETLAELMLLADTEAAYLVFIVPRSDCASGLELNKLDPTYCKAVSNAVEQGVKVLVFSLDFQKDGTVNYANELDFHIPS